MKIAITINNKEYEVEIKDEDVKKIEQASKKVKLRPDLGDYYWIIVMDNAEIDEYPWDNDDIDNNNWDSGNGFFAKEEAEKELAKRQAIQRVKDYIIENGLEFTPDWGDFEEQKYSIWYDHAIKELNYDLSWFCQHERSFYFKSKKDALQVIKACSSDLKIIYGVKEEK